MNSNASTATTASDITTSTVTVVNHALETLIETVTRSFITAGGDEGMQFRNDITSLVDTAARYLRLSSAANRQARMSLHVQYIQVTVAYWYNTIMEGSNDTFVPIDNGIIEEAIQETMNLFDNAN